MNKKISTVVILIIMIVLISCTVVHFINRNNTYKKGLECFENKYWGCVIQNFSNLDYKDSKAKLKIARFENYIDIAKTDINMKAYKDALQQYKSALVIEPENEDIKIKIENLKIIINEQDKLEAQKRKIQDEENHKKAIQAKISDAAIYPIPTQYGQGYDNTIRRYGVATINRINKLAPKAAELVAQNPRCTRVMAVDVADDKSTRNSITFFVDCGDIDHIRDIQRFYITEKEINANSIPKSVKEQSEKIDDTQYLMMCEAEIKTRLNYPSTYKSNILLSSVTKAPMNTVVTIPFKAKNAFNLELKHRGSCYYNGVSLTDINIKEEQ